MPKMIDDKQMKRGDCEFLFSGNTMACKWMDNQSMLLLSSALEGMNDILSIQGRESSVTFYLCIFFDLMDIVCVNSYLIYNMKYNNKLSLLDYKIVVAKNLIQYHQG